MKKIIVFILLSLLLVNCSEYLSSGLQSEMISVNNKQFNVLYGSDTLYVIQKVSDYSYPYNEYEKILRINSKENIQIINNKYFKINGINKKINFHSSQPKVIEISDNGCIKINSVGSTNIIVTIDNQSTYFNLTVIEIPINKLMNKNAIIESIGVPDDVHEILIDYFSNITFDKIFYTGISFTGSVTKIEHWFYHKYPNTIIRFYNNKLNDCIIPEWTYLTSH